MDTAKTIGMATDYKQLCGQLNFTVKILTNTGLRHSPKQVVNYTKDLQHCLYNLLEYIIDK